jgi:hypothetical protein
MSPKGVEIFLREARGIPFFESNFAYKISAWVSKSELISAVAS